MSTQPRSTVAERPRPPVRVLRLALLAVTSAACLVASAFHFGLRLEVGSLTLVEPTILAAAIVEGAIGIALAVAAGALLTDQPWARGATIGAYLFGILGFLIGITALARNPGLQTPFNVAVHAGVFPLLLIGLALELVAMRAGARAGRDPA